MKLFPAHGSNFLAQGSSIKILSQDAPLQKIRIATVWALVSLDAFSLPAEMQFPESEEWRQNISIERGDGPNREAIWRYVCEVGEREQHWKDGDILPHLNSAIWWNEICKGLGGHWNCCECQGLSCEAAEWWEKFKQNPMLAFSDRFFWHPSDKKVFDPEKRKYTEPDSIVCYFPDSGDYSHLQVGNFMGRLGAVKTWKQPRQFQEAQADAEGHRLLSIYYRANTVLRRSVSQIRDRLCERGFTHRQPAFIEKVLGGDVTPWGNLPANLRSGVMLYKDVHAGLVSRSLVFEDPQWAVVYALEGEATDEEKRVLFEWLTTVCPKKAPSQLTRQRMQDEFMFHYRNHYLFLREHNEELRDLLVEVRRGRPFTLAGCEKNIEAGDCAICLSSLNDEAAEKLGCGHTFHTSCLLTVKVASEQQAARGDGIEPARCPLCRAEMNLSIAP